MFGFGGPFMKLRCFLAVFSPMKYFCSDAVFSRSQRQPLEEEKKWRKSKFRKMYLKYFHFITFFFFNLKFDKSDTNEKFYIQTLVLPGASPASVLIWVPLSSCH